MYVALLHLWSGVLWACFHRETLRIVTEAVLDAAMTMDETLYGVADKVQNFAVIYLVDINLVPDFNKVRRSRYRGVVRRVLLTGPSVQMCELYDPCTVMFFYRYVPQ